MDTILNRKGITLAIGQVINVSTWELFISKKTGDYKYNWIYSDYL